jgi:hypothetical protein
MTRPLACLLALTLLPAPLSAQPSAAGVTARGEHDVAMAAYERGDLDIALAGFQRAYALLPDPLADRAARGQVLGALRSTWAALYARTHARAHLCDWRAALVAHTERLRSALGPEAAREDTAGLDHLLAQTDAELARDFPAAADCGAEPVPAPPPPPSATTVPPLVAVPPRDDAPPHATTSAPLAAVAPRDVGPTRRLRLAGASLLAVGGVAVLGMTAAGIVVADRRQQVISLDRTLLDAGRPPTADEVARVDALGRQGAAANAATIGLGVVGGALVVVGAALLTRSRHRAPRLGFAPQLGPDRWGLALHGRIGPLRR